MADKKAPAERFNKSRNSICDIQFAQIVVDESKNLCHREAAMLKEEKLSDLATSLVQEGQATPLTVYKSDVTLNINGEDLPVYVLVGGHRRFEAIKSAIEGHLDPGRIHKEMVVSVVEMVPGDDQSRESFDQDVLVRSVAENEQRVKHSAIERLAIVQQMETAEIPVPRAASALGISQSQYRRDAIVVNWKWLYDAVVAEQIGASDAAKVAEVAKDKKREQEFREDFEEWVRHKTIVLDDERSAQRKLGKELRGSSAVLKEYIDSDLIKSWIKCLSDGRRFTEKPDSFSFGVVVDENKKTVTVSALNEPIDKLKSVNIASMIAEMQAGVRKLVPVMRRLQQLEQATTVTPDEVEAELAKIADELRAAEEEKARREAGRVPKVEQGGDKTPPLNLAEKIDEQLGTQNDGENQ